MVMARRLGVWAAITCLLGVGCGGSGGDDGPGGHAAGGQGTGAAGQGGAGAGGGSTGGQGTGGTEACTGAGLLADLGKDHVLVGVSTFDGGTAAEPFDLQYRYLSAGVPDGAGPCGACDATCTTFGQSCATGCAWWGCWQSPADPPGAYVRGFVAGALAEGQIPMITYYEVLQASGVAEGAAEVAVMNDATFLARYLADFRFMLQNVDTAPAIIHAEPDFWGYAEQQNPDPHALPAAVPQANPTDCASEEASIAGLARCLVAMTRKYAPNAKIGLHGSPWATMFDVVQNTDPGFDVAGHAATLGAFLLAAAPGADLVIVDVSDRDAGYDQSNGQDTWWDATNQSLPNFSQALTWQRSLSEAMGVGNLVWQIPIGNMGQPNTPNHWQDNRVEYYFAHMGEVAAAHTVGLAFGAGQGDQTTAETDGGLLVSLTQTYASGGAQPLCP